MAKKTKRKFGSNLPKRLGMSAAKVKRVLSRRDTVYQKGNSGGRG